MHGADRAARREALSSRPARIGTQGYARGRIGRIGQTIHVRATRRGIRAGGADTGKIVSTRWRFRVNSIF
jgi:hypothetical protein